MEITFRRPRGRPIGSSKRPSATLAPLAHALRAARTSVGVTMRTLAEHLGISHAVIGKVEAAQTFGCTLSEDTLRAAAAFLRCDPAPLLAARDRSRFSYALPNLSAEHAETAIALRDAWAALDAATLARVRAAIGGDQ